MKTALILHAKSAALTFGAVLAVELYAATETMAQWQEVPWEQLLSAATFTAARAVLKLAITTKAEADS